MSLPHVDRMRARLTPDYTDVRVLLIHPMHAGDRINPLGFIDSSAFIQDIRCWRNGEQMIAIKCSARIAQDPYFSFRLHGGKVGDLIKLRWVDNHGAKGVLETQVF